MIKEFALEPEVLADPANIRYFLEQFDIHKGRLIAEYPKRWASEVHKIVASKLTDMQRKKFHVQLERLDGKLLAYDARRPYRRESTSWLQNVESVQAAAVAPFDGIIAVENPRSHTDVLIADNVDESQRSWAVPRQIWAARTTSDCLAAASRLLDLSREVILVDPYFDSTDSRWKRMLKALIFHASNNGLQKSRIELHCCVHPKSSRHFWQDCRDELPSWLPTGTKLVVRRWQAKRGGERFHRRYLLTERGGLAFEGGLDEGTANETTDIYLLEESLRLQRWPEYQPNSKAFDVDPSGPVTIVGTWASR